MHVNDKEKHLEVLTSRWNIERGENRCFIDKGVLRYETRVLVTLKFLYANFRCEMMHNIYYKSQSERDILYNQIKIIFFYPKCASND